MSEARTISRPAFGLREVRIYGAHGMASAASNLLITCFFFYAKRIFFWSSSQCLMLVAAEGVVYVIGALAANHLARGLGRQKAIAMIQAVLGCLCGVAWLHPTPRSLVAILLAYTMVSAAGWPVFESLLTAGAGPGLMWRRITVYNLVWSGTNAATLAISGLIIDRCASALFAIPLACYAMGVLLLCGGGIEPEEPQAAPAATAEPGLLRQRRLALWLSRIGLPASYTVMYSLAALMPSLRVVQSFSPAGQTVAASLWMGTRFLAFGVLGVSDWWHTRPRVLLAATLLMSISFLGVTLRPADILGGGGSAVTGLDQILMIAWQIPLGLTMGLIYSGSLYFGMVLSEGSTEHGGYHEALIGMGQVAGPVAALVGQGFSGGGTPAAVAAVGGVLAVCLVGATGVTVRQGDESQ